MAILETQATANTQDYTFAITAFAHRFLITINSQTPGASFGSPVRDVDDAGVATLFTEARNAISGNAHTAAVLCCRKMLMRIAVIKGAKENEGLKYYVDYLANNNHIPQGSKEWVDHIRNKGNEANHDIVLSSPEEAKELVSFVEMLLKVMFEYPAIAKRRIAQSNSGKPVSVQAR